MQSESSSNSIPQTFRPMVIKSACIAVLLSVAIGVGWGIESNSQQRLIDEERNLLQKIEAFRRARESKNVVYAHFSNQPRYRLKRISDQVFQISYDRRSRLNWTADRAVIIQFTFSRGRLATVQRSESEFSL